MNFYLGTHMPNWLAYPGERRLFISRNRLRRRKAAVHAKTDWALDSGGYTAMMNGGWSITPKEYSREVVRYHEYGRLQWCAIQDWMCTPKALKQTGKTVASHQRLTTQSLIDLRSLTPEIKWIPILQGFAINDYLRHIDTYGAHGIDLQNESVVGVGSIAARQDRPIGLEILRVIAGRGIRLHGFGLKVSSLRRVSHLLVSADSLSWSFEARRRKIQLAGCRHKTCANCWQYASKWYDWINHEILAGRAPRGILG